MERVKLATVWLGGCSGCHMSFLDLDEWLFELGQMAELVFSPIADIKEFPKGVDIVLVEGAVANEENLRMAKRIRERSAIVVSFGDCAVTGNVTAMRNPHGLGLEVLRTVYLVPEPGTKPVLPSDQEIVPALLDQVLPLHAVITVDHFLPGCPPSADRIRMMIEDLRAGREPARTADRIRFG
jgi:NAD-reducing hydrogenase small subunit